MKWNNWSCLHYSRKNSVLKNSWRRCIITSLSSLINDSNTTLNNSKNNLSCRHSSSCYIKFSLNCPKISNSCIITYSTNLISSDSLKIITHCTITIICLKYNCELINRLIYTIIINLRHLKFINYLIT